MQLIAKYKEAFLREAKGYARKMEELFLKLEKNPSKIEIVNNIFRITHTLKSISAIAEHVNIAGLCHAIEDVLDLIRKKKIKASQCTDLLFEGVDSIGLCLKAAAEDRDEINTDNLVKRMKDFTRASGPVTSAPSHESRVTSDETVLTEDKITAIEVKVEKLDILMNLAEELIIVKMKMDGIKEALQDTELSAAVDTFGRLIGNMQFHIMESRTLPVSFVFNRFPRMVRDMAKQERKEINLEIEGADIELDRSIVEDLIEPLAHILRNSVDHGIETVEQRKKAGKTPYGTIKLSAKRDKGYAVIEVSDDGAGIDWTALKLKAIKQGLIPQNPTEEEIAGSIFSGVSTTKEVTAISGRGFGLNIVKKKIESIGGDIKVSGNSSSGTKFVITIPLTLAVFKALFVIVGGKSYVISLTNVERLIVVKNSDIKGMIDYEAVVLDGEDIPITRLCELFKTEGPVLDKQPIVIIRKDNTKLGLAVDAFGDAQEIVLKPLRLVTENKYVSGCTITGQGEVVLILDVSNLILSKRRIGVSV